jgi:hypothetical protein
LRWEGVDLPVSAIRDPDQIDSAIKESIEGLHRQTRLERGETKAVGCRIELTGVSECHRALRRQVEAGGLEALRLVLDGVLYFVDRVIDASRPALDLESIAGQDNPPALLAGRLLSLARRDDASRVLIQRARVELLRVNDQRIWTRLDRSAPDDEAIRRLLIEAGTRALEELLGQTAEARP